jgi:hypothetical protein
MYLEASDDHRMLAEINELTDKIAPEWIGCNRLGWRTKFENGQEWIEYFCVTGDSLSTLAVAAWTWGVARQALDTVGVVLASTRIRSHKTAWMVFSPDGFRGYPSETIGSEMGYEDYTEALLVGCRWAARHIDELIREDI